MSLAQGGTVVNADREFAADVLIEDGLIKAVESNIEACSCTNTALSIVLCLCAVLLTVACVTHVAC